MLVRTNTSYLKLNKTNQNTDSYIKRITKSIRFSDDFKGSSRSTDVLIYPRRLFSYWQTKIALKIFAYQSCEVVTLKHLFKGIQDQFRNLLNFRIRVKRKSKCSQDEFE